MTDKIFEEENHIYQIDFSAALWATDQLHTVFQTNTVSLLSDVDFVAETEDEVLLVEYKNANISNASNPGAFRPRDQKLVQKIAFKYYDSWIYLLYLKKVKPFHYIYILEYPDGDAVSRRWIRNMATRMLPFGLQNLPEIQDNIISAFDVLSIQEWNEHDTYKAFPITPVQNSTMNEE